MQRERRLSGAARAAAALIGVRLADDAIASGGADPTDAQHPPQWLVELDEYEEGEELWLALYSPLDEVHKARIAAAAAVRGDAEGEDHPAGPQRTSAVAWFGRRGTCTTTKG